MAARKLAGLLHRLTGRSLGLPGGYACTHEAMSEALEPGMIVFPPRDAKARRPSTSISSRCSSADLLL